MESLIGAVTMSRLRRSCLLRNLSEVRISKAFALRFESARQGAAKAKGAPGGIYSATHGRGRGTVQSKYGRTDMRLRRERAVKRHRRPASSTKLTERDDPLHPGANAPLEIPQSRSIDRVQRWIASRSSRTASLGQPNSIPLRAANGRGRAEPEHMR